MPQGSGRSVERLKEYERELGFAPRHEETSGPDIKVSGSRTLQNAFGRSLRVSGSATVIGDASVGELKVSGSADIGGGLDAEVTKVSGTCRVGGNMRVTEAKVSGCCHVAGSARVQGAMRVSGVASVGSIFEGGNLKSSGLVEIGGDLTAQDLTISGAGRVKGITKAHSIDVRIHGGDVNLEGGVETEVMTAETAGRSSTMTILGICPQVIRARGHVRAPFIRCAGDLYLERTICDLVEGSSVHIGAGCRIGKVRYRQQIRIEPKADVSGEPEKIS